MKIKTYFLLSLVVITSFLSQIMFKDVAISLPKTKLSIDSITFSVFHTISNPLFILAFALYGISAILWLLSIKSATLSKAFSMLSLIYVLIVSYSFFVLKEEFTLNKLFSSIFIIIGILIITQNEKLKLWFNNRNK